MRRAFEGASVRISSFGGRYGSTVLMKKEEEESRSGLADNREG